MPFDWLRDEHPFYTANKERWATDERRYYGAQEVLAELVPFDWETDQESGGHYALRQAQAVYVNFPELFARTMVGHLFSKAPQADAGLDFGTLGLVERDNETDATPSRAELIYENADGIGNHASQWDNFWSTAMQHAMVTGHRWIFTESPRDVPENFADEIDGLRPYLVEYSPLEITNWHFEAGRLEWAVVKLSERRPRVVDGSLEGNEPEDRYLLLVRAGVKSLDEPEAEEETFSEGGWWLFDSDLEMITEAVQTAEGEDPALVPVHGDWEKTQGQIPMVALYYDRVSNPVIEAMSRSGTMEVGQAAVSYMNLSSAADFDAWDAAQSIHYLLGVDENGYKLALDVRAKGSQMIPLPVNVATGTVPNVIDGSTGAVTSQVFEDRLERKRTESTEVAALEASATPESSGQSKRAGFADIKGPRLALMASEIEAAQNATIRFLEQRWGTGQPTGEANWPREFDLLPLVDSVREIMELLSLGQISSATLKLKGIMAAAERKGLVADEEEEATIRAELAASANSDATEAGRLGAETAAIEAAVARAAAQTGGTPRERGEPVPA